jgi:hypothetical protein
MIIIIIIFGSKRAYDFNIKMLLIFHYQLPERLSRQPDEDATRLLPDFLTQPHVTLSDLEAGVECLLKARSNNCTRRTTNSLTCYKLVEERLLYSYPRVQVGQKTHSFTRLTLHCYTESISP